MSDTVTISRDSLDQAVADAVAALEYVASEQTVSEHAAPTRGASTHVSSGPSGPGQESGALAIAVAEVAVGVLSRLTDLDPAAMSSEDLLTFTGLLGNAGRLVEGRQVANVGDIARRSDTQSGMDGLAATHGASSPAGLLEKITGVKASTARRYVQVATHTTPRATDTGLPLPPVFSQTGEALSEGLIGLDAAEALTSTLAPVLPRAVPDEVDQAEETLLGNATGAHGQVPVSADSLRVQARAFTVALDPDGVEPSAEEQHQGRRLSLRTRSDGSLGISGVLSPEQAAVVTPVFDAFLSSRTGPRFVDAEEQRGREDGSEKRSRAQERADVFTTLLGGLTKLDKQAKADKQAKTGRRPKTNEQATAGAPSSGGSPASGALPGSGDAAGSGALPGFGDAAGPDGLPGSVPKLHGRGPTVLVTVTDSDLHAGSGAAWSPGTPEPLPVSFVRQAQCDGDTINVAINEHGDVTGMSGPKRFFTNQQRLALIARDGPTCVVDDCPIPAWLCEAHHIDGWAKGGPTEISNGVLLCWFHHRLIERGQWAITRDDTGIPRVVPPDWYVSRDYIKTRRIRGSRRMSRHRQPTSPSAPTAPRSSTGPPANTAPPSSTDPPPDADPPADADRDSKPRH